MHWALKAILGKEIKQAGSYVADDRFRFDYITEKALTKEQLEKLETIMNDKIQQDDIVRCFETTLEYAKEIGAIALFEEKYQKFVRVVEIDNYSRELCGGIHVKRTGEIGLIKILSDTSIGQNIRRIEAVTGMHAYNYLKDISKKIGFICDEVESDPKNVIEKIINLKKSFKKLNEELLSLQIKAIKQEILSSKLKFNIDNIDVILFDFTESKFNLELDPKKMGIIGDDLINLYNNKNLFLAFYNLVNGKPIILLQCSKNLTKYGLDCSILAKELTKIIKGGGGGKAEFAQIGGFDNNLVTKAFDFIKNYIINLIKTNKKE